MKSLSQRLVQLATLLPFIVATLFLVSSQAEDWVIDNSYPEHLEAFSSWNVQDQFTTWNHETQTGTSYRITKIEAGRVTAVPEGTVSQLPPGTTIHNDPKLGGPTNFQFSENGNGSATGPNPSQLPSNEDGSAEDPGYGGQSETGGHAPGTGLGFDIDGIRHAQEQDFKREQYERYIENVKASLRPTLLSNELKSKMTQQSQSISLKAEQIQKDTAHKAEDLSDGELYKWASDPSLNKESLTSGNGLFAKYRPRYPEGDFSKSIRSPHARGRSLRELQGEEEAYYSKLAEIYAEGTNAFVTSVSKLVGSTASEVSRGLGQGIDSITNHANEDSFKDKASKCNDDIELVECLSHYPFQSTEGPEDLKKELIKTQMDLRKAQPKSPQGKNAKIIGLKAVREGDRSLSRKDIGQTKSFLKIAGAMLELATAFTPPISFATDLFSVITEKNFFTGEKLDATAYKFAVFGALTGGLGSKIAKGAKLALTPMVGALKKIVPNSDKLQKMVAKYEEFVDAAQRIVGPGKGKVADSAGKAAKPTLSKQNRSKRKLQPDPKATADHTTFKRDQKAGKASQYVTWSKNKNPKDPKNFKTEKRYDSAGDAHYNKKTGSKIDVPHIHDKKTPGGVRKPNPNETP